MYTGSGMRSGYFVRKLEELRELEKDVTRDEVVKMLHACELQDRVIKIEEENESKIPFWVRVAIDDEIYYLKKVINIIEEENERNRIMVS